MQDLNKEYIVDRLKTANEEELKQIVIAANNMTDYYAILSSLASDELASRDPNKPVQLNLF